MDELKTLSKKLKEMEEKIDICSRAILEAAEEQKKKRIDFETTHCIECGTPIDSWNWDEIIETEDEIIKYYYCPKCNRFYEQHFKFHYSHTEPAVEEGE